ncbi:MAG: ROK family transcriptional regulator [Spirochaetaceae bacterium]|nr:MAG: ROK family transcriptional regulator [Spirochaetaceae bacterium]
MTKELTVGINTARILRTLWINRTMSQIELARTLGITKSTVSKLVNELHDTGIISIISKGDAGPLGGRKPVFLSLNSAYGAVLGVEIQTDFFVAVLINLHGEILYTVKKAFNLGSMTIADAFCSIYDDIVPGFREMRVRIIGAAIGCGGIINPYNGIVSQSNPLNIRASQNVYEALDRRLDIPVLIENDANCGAWGELAFGTHRENPRDFIYVLGETRNNKAINAEYRGIAIGTSIVLGDRVHYGQDFSSGEFQSVFRSGEHLNQFDMSDVEAGIYEEDEGLFLKVARELSKNIAFLVNMLNLKEVILGGRIEYHPEILDVMQDEVFKNWSYDSPTRVRVRFSQLQEQTVAYGAAGMFLEQLFSLPDVSASKHRGDANRLRERTARATSFTMEAI